jgi:hypothetical protein
MRDGRERSTHLEVLDLPTPPIVRLLLPLLVLGNREKRNLLLVLANLDDRGDELDKEVLELEKGGEPVVEEVDNETLDVRTVVILRRRTEERGERSERGRGGGGGRGRGRKSQERRNGEKRRKGGRT